MRESRTTRPPRLAILLPETSPALAARIEAASSCFSVVAPSAVDARRLDADYFYAPDAIEGMLSPNQLRNVLLGLCAEPADFVIVSHGLGSGSAVTVASTGRNVVFAGDAYRERREGNGELGEGRVGRVVRLLPGPGESVPMLEKDVSELGLGGLRVAGATLVRGRRPRRFGPRGREGLDLDGTLLFAPPTDGRPLVFVLPIMMAVGGAERVVIETMRALCDRFAFVVIVTEPTRQEWGSLNHQLVDCTEAVFDLGEIADRDRHLRLLRLLAAAYAPELVFLSNGSPWLARTLPALRELFAGVPIVDQQAYDAREGWIQAYGRPGFRSLDRYVAVNRPILRALHERFGIPEARIDLIQPGIDAERFNPVRANAVDREAECGALGLPASRRLVAQVGRLVAQKRPLDFLELARHRQSLADDEHFFVLVGDGELARRCDGYVREHRLANVRRIPHVEDMSRLLPLLDAMVFCSAFEGLPVALLEGLAMGVPILSTEVGDIGPLLRAQGSGRTFDANGGAAELREAFAHFVRDHAALRAAARGRAEEIAERYSAGRIAREQYAACWRRAREDVGVPFRHQGGPSDSKFSFADRAFLRDWLSERRRIRAGWRRVKQLRDALR